MNHSAIPSYSNTSTGPQHVAIIMDGNGRWAQAQGKPRSMGHKKGAEATKRIIETCIQLDIPYLTLYTFSSENWNRSSEEIDELMNLLRFYLRNELPRFHKQNIKLRIIGDRALLASDIQEHLTKAETLTQNNTALTLNIALSYGSRQEITHAVQQLSHDILAGTLLPEDINSDCLDSYLYTHRLPDPDLLIRTGGEQRLSNFLLWQCAYTELFFTDILWPDFQPTDFEEAVNEFMQRERRYGSA